MNQQEVKPTDVEISKSKEDKTARNGLIRGILAVLLVPPFVYFGAGFLYLFFTGAPKDTIIPVLFFGALTIVLLTTSIITNIKATKSSPKGIAKIGLILSALAIIFGFVAAIIALIDAKMPGGLFDME